MHGSRARTAGAITLGFALGAGAAAAPSTLVLIALMLETGHPLRDPPVVAWLGVVLGLLLPPVAGYWPARRFGVSGFLGSVAGCVAGVIAALVLPIPLLEATGTPWQSTSFAGAAAWMGTGGWCLSIILFGGFVGLLRRQGASAPVEPMRW